MCFPATSTHAIPRLESLENPVSKQRPRLKPGPLSSISLHRPLVVEVSFVLPWSRSQCQFINLITFKP